MESVNITSKKPYFVQTGFSNGNSCIEMLQYLILDNKCFLHLDLGTRKVVLLAHNFLKIDSRITKMFRGRSFRYQVFT